MYKLILLVLITLVTVACNQASTPSFSTIGAWVREAPPNAHAMAGYVTIKNNTDQAHTLSYAKSEQFNMVEIHRTIVEDGVAKMRRQNDLPMPAGGTLVLKPGSYHLMLMAPKSAFKAGDEVTVTVGMKSNDESRAKIKEIDIVMPVQKANK